MRLFVLLAGAAFVLAACNKSDRVENAAAGGESLTAESISSNDITAIDAVTGEDANMAADVNYLDMVANNGAAGNNAASASRPATPRPGASAPTTNTSMESAPTNNATD